MRIGVISDTHGYLDPDVLRAFAGVEVILHAGDIGDAAVLRGLEGLAPVAAVRGNNDRTGEVACEPLERRIDVEGKGLFLTHQATAPKSPDDARLVEYRRQGIAVVVSGHSHMARQETVGGVLFFNPGAAGKPRFRLVPSVGILTIENGIITGAIETLRKG